MKVECNPARFRADRDSLWSLSEGWKDSSIRLDTSYEVFALGTYDGVTKVLIDGEMNYRPFWYSLDHFKISNHKVNGSWVVAFRPGKWSLIMGYPMLVHSPEHFDGILERNKDDLIAFRAAAEQHYDT